MLKMTNKSKISMMISYNSSQIIKDRFKDWNVAEYDLTYSMRTTGDYMREQKERKELLLMNYGPKVKLSFDGCYNYKKLKDEGLAS